MRSIRLITAYGPNSVNWLRSSESIETHCSAGKASIPSLFALIKIISPCSGRSLSEEKTACDVNDLAFSSTSHIESAGRN